MTCAHCRARSGSAATARRSTEPTRYWICTSSSARALSTDVRAQDGVAIAQRVLGSQRVLHFSERALRGTRVGRHGLLLFRGADVDLRAQRAALVDRRNQVGAEAEGRIAPFLQHEHIARNAAAAGGQADARQPRGLCFADPVECRSDAALGGDHVRSALEQLRRHSHGHRCGHRRKLLRDRDLRRRVASNEQFERAQRLLARQFDLAQHVTIAAGVGARFRYRLLVAVADAQSLLRELQQRLGRMQRLDDDPRAAIPLRWPRTRPLPPSPPWTGGHTA